MLNLLSNVLNLIVGISTPDPEHLRSRRVENQFQVEIGEKVIYRREILPEGIPSVSSEGKVGDEEYLLIEESHGDGCPVMYTLITKTKGGRHQELLIGNCNEVRVEATGDRLEFSFPAYAEIPSRKAAKWLYQEEKLTKLP